MPAPLFAPRLLFRSQIAVKAALPDPLDDDHHYLVILARLRFAPGLPALPPQLNNRTPRCNRITAARHLWFYSDYADKFLLFTLSYARVSMPWSQLLLPLVCWRVRAAGAAADSGAFIAAY